MPFSEAASTAIRTCPGPGSPPSATSWTAAAASRPEMASARVIAAPRRTGEGSSLGSTLSRLPPVCVRTPLATAGCSSTPPRRCSPDAAERARAEADPWQAFTGQPAFLCGLQADNRALADVLTFSGNGAPELAKLRDRAFDGTIAILQRAQASGDLRPDFHHTDAVLLLMANAAADL